MNDIIKASVDILMLLSVRCLVMAAEIVWDGSEVEICDGYCDGSSEGCCDRSDVAT